MMDIQTYGPNLREEKRVFLLLNKPFTLYFNKNSFSLYAEKRHFLSFISNNTFIFESNS